MSENVKTVDLPEIFQGMKPVVNDFQINVATMNGTGSQTSNQLIIRALFHMGIPVNGKNIFPSNIKTLPTWFQIRANKSGYIARKEISEVLVAFNKDSILTDVARMPPGGVVLYDPSTGFKPQRDDLLFYELPKPRDILKQAEIAQNLIERVANMVYVGALAQIIGIELSEIERGLMESLKGKKKAVDLNMNVIQLAYDYAAENYVRPCPYRVERMNGTEGLILMEGNAAGALGAVFGGATFLAWYPITPSSSFADSMMGYLAEFRHTEDGKATYAIIQAEDELSAIGMVVGAGWAGARSLTATSGPGMSLMGEFAGMAYFAEIPAVIWNIQRVGPSTGMPTRTSQGDILAAYLLGHGDTKHICLLPGSLKEIFEFGWRAFDVAEQFQTLVFVLSDLDLGMNLWMSEPFDYPDEPMNRGKVLDAAALSEHIKTNGKWGRYLDVDGDGISYRTLPGIDHPLGSYFARGTGHNEMAVYSEEAQDWFHNMQRLTHKFETAREQLPGPIITAAQGKTKVGLIAYGSIDSAVLEGLDRLAEESMYFDYMRVRALPLSKAVRKFIESHDYVYVIENNHDGQLAKITIMDYPDLGPKIRSLAYLDGLPFTARFIKESLMEREGVK